MQGLEEHGEAACWISGWQTLLGAYLSIAEWVHFKENDIWEDLCSRITASSKKFVFSLLFPPSLFFLNLFAFTSLFFLSFTLFLPPFLPFSPAISCDACIEILGWGRHICALCNHFCQKDRCMCANEDREITLTLCHRFAKELRPEGSSFWKYRVGYEWKGDFQSTEEKREM